MGILSEIGDFLSGGVGSLASGVLGFLGQDKTNETNVALGREQMAFQERMSNTSYQRAVKDMQAAGLNPMLAYSQGGASSPVGSMPQVQNAVGTGVAAAAQAASVMQAVQQVKKTQADTDYVMAQAARTRAETLAPELYSAQGWSNLYLTHAQTGKSDADRRLTEENAQIADKLRAIRELELRRGSATFGDDVLLRKLERQLREFELPGARNEAGFQQDTGQASQLIRLLQQILGAGHSAKSLSR